jgi:hypothetical protein
MSGATASSGHVTTNGEMKLTEGTSVFCSGEMGTDFLLLNIPAWSRVIYRLGG